MRGWDGSATGLKFFSYEHSILVTGIGTKQFDKIASLSQQRGHNSIILRRMYFYLRSKRFILVM